MAMQEMRQRGMRREEEQQFRLGRDSVTIRLSFTTITMALIVQCNRVFAAL